MGYFILIIILAGAAYYILTKKKTPGRDFLREECLLALRLPPSEAEKTLERHMELLRKKHPGKDEKWRLEKILYDMGKDRR